MISRSVELGPVERDCNNRRTILWSFLFSLGHPGRLFNAREDSNKDDNCGL